MYQYSHFEVVHVLNWEVKCCFPFWGQNRLVGNFKLVKGTKKRGGVCVQKAKKPKQIQQPQKPTKKFTKIPNQQNTFL